MSKIIAEHPSPEQLRAYTQGRLAPVEASAVEGHILACELCCRALEEVSADSFESRLRGAEQAAFATTADGTSHTLHDPPAVPRELVDHPRYRVLALVGQGGMGAVYKAEHRRMERPVALKVINPAFLRNPTTVSRFQQEVRAAAKLTHPNIVTAYDADQAGELHFLVMEFVEGQTLADVVRDRGSLSVVTACEYARQGALGLQHLHESGLIHRDVKPHNLMLTPGGVIKLLDCGLVRIAADTEAEQLAGECPLNPSLTVAGAVMGTADYIAPEQIADSRTADIRADIYSLGCTLFHLLAGRPPFFDDLPPDKFKHHAQTPLPIQAEWPEELKSVLRKMTAKKPEDRYATPAEVATALEPHTLAKPVERKPRRRWIAVASLLLLLGAVVAAGVVILRVPTDRGEVVLVTDDDSLELTARKGGEIIRIRDPKTEQIWDVDTKNYRIASLDHPDGLTIELPERGTVTFKRKGGGKVTVTTGPKGVESPVAQAKVVRIPDAAELAKLPSAADALRHADIPEAVRAYLTGGDPSKAPPELVAVFGDVRFRCPSYANQPRYSPDGKFLVVPSWRKGVLLFDAVIGRVVRSIPTEDANEAILSPDNKLLAVTDDYAVEIWDVENGKRLHHFKEEEEPGIVCAKIAFSPDGKLLAAGSGECRQMRVWDVTTGKERLYWNGMQTKKERLPIDQVAFSADGKLLAAVEQGDGARFWKVLPGGKFEETKLDKDTPAKGALLIAFSPDGNAIALWNSDRNVVCLCDANGKARHNLPAAGCTALNFASDSRTLIATCSGASGQAEYGVRRWDVATGKLLSNGGFPGIKRSAPYSISPDGRTVAAVPGEYENVVRLFDTETGKPLIADIGHVSGAAHLAFSPDGKTLISSERQLRLWNLATAKPIDSWSDSAGRGGVALAFSPDGKMLALGRDYGVHVCDPVTGKHLHSFSGPEKWITSIVFSPDGKLLACGGGDRTLWIWRTDNGKTHRILDQQAQTDALCFSPDGKFLVSVTGEHDYTYRVWDVARGEEKLPKPRIDESAYSLAMRPDGKMVAGLRFDGEFFLSDWETGKLKQEFPGPYFYDGEKNYPMALALGPVGYLAATQHRDRRLLVWQPGTSPLRRKSFHLGPVGVEAVAFSPDGRYVACGTPDGLICLLRLSDRGQVPTLPAMEVSPMPRPAGKP